MNQTIETLLQHRSIRKFKDEQLTTEQIHAIIRAAQQAATSSHVMAYTIIGVTDPTLKTELSKVSGQPYVQENGHLFVFCADLNRIQQLASAEEQVVIQENMESTEQFIITVVDTALAAQNAATAAESMGLGICFLGSLRNDIQRVSTLLNLPDRVIPLFGLAAGYPDQQPEIKPRLPLEAVYHENTYPSEKAQQQLVQEFDKELLNYYQNRTSNARKTTWSSQMLNKYKRPTRLDVGPFVKEKHLNKQ